MCAAICYTYEFYITCMASALAVVLGPCCGSVLHLMRNFLMATCFGTDASEEGWIQILRLCQGWLALVACRSLYLSQDLSSMSVMQALAEAGLRGADWPEEVEGTYLRMDVPHVVPHLLSWLEQQKPGTVKR